jgi:DnaK suppressor protein
MKREESIFQLRQVLVERRDALRRALAGDLADLQKVQTGHSNGDMIDEAIKSDRDAVSSQLAEVESHELGRVEKALELIIARRYGICENCEAVIPIVRLNALPYATRCVKCQRRLEELQVSAMLLPPDPDDDQEG